MRSPPATVAAPSAPAHAMDARSPPRPWLGSHASGHAGDQSATNEADTARRHVAHGDRRSGSHMRPWRRCALAYELPLSAGRLPARSDILLACRPHWVTVAVAVSVFGLL